MRPWIQLLVQEKKRFIGKSDVRLKFLERFSGNNQFLKCKERIPDLGILGHICNPATLEVVVGRSQLPRKSSLSEKNN
jgi:hypothetical protein